MYDLVATILYGDIIQSEEKYLVTNPRLALSLAEAACTSLADNFESEIFCHVKFCRRTVMMNLFSRISAMGMKGYDDAGGWSTIDSSLREIAEAAKPVLTEEEGEEAAGWMEELHQIGEPYCMTMDTDILRTVEFLRAGDNSGKSEDPDGTSASNDGDSGLTAVASKKSHEGIAAPNDVTKENVLNASVAGK